MNLSVRTRTARRVDHWLRRQAASMREMRKYSGMRWRCRCRKKQFCIDIWRTWYSLQNRRFDRPKPLHSHPLKLSLKVCTDEVEL